MKRTEITYKKTHNGYRIVAINNCATKCAISTEFGFNVAAEYFESLPNYYMNESLERSFVVNNKKLFIGDVLTPKSFHSLIKAMKAAGQRLIEIKDKNVEAKTILI